MTNLLPLVRSYVESAGYRTLSEDRADKHHSRFAVNSARTMVSVFSVGVAEPAKDLTRPAFPGRVLCSAGLWATNGAFWPHGYAINTLRLGESNPGRPPRDCRFGTD